METNVPRARPAGARGVRRRICVGRRLDRASIESRSPKGNRSQVQAMLARYEWSEVRAGLSHQQAHSLVKSRSAGDQEQRDLDQAIAAGAPRQSKSHSSRDQETGARNSCVAARIRCEETNNGRIPGDVPRPNCELCARLEVARGNASQSGEGACDMSRKNTSQRPLTMRDRQKYFDAEFSEEEREELRDRIIQE